MSGIARRLGLLIVLLAALAVSRRASAHDLVVDQLVLFPRFPSGALRAELSFDPELTRSFSEPFAREAFAARVRAFVEKELAVAVDGDRCRPKLEVRELFVPGGAAPADIVMIDCPLPAGSRELSVAVGGGFRAPLLVSVEGEGGAGSRQSTLISPGQRTPPFRFAAPNERWRQGPAESFLPDAGAGPAPSSAVPVTDAERRPRAPAGEFAPEPAIDTFTRFVVLGFRHIVPDGWDHLLFVAGLVLGARRRYRRLVLELSAFTAAHTLTLALGALGLIVVPARVVEPLIALSVAVVAIENLLDRRDARYRLPLVLAFGLLHGQGFAGSLAGTGLPESAFLTALFSFNLGVELGQLAVVAALALLLLPLRDPEAASRYVVRPGSLAIAAVGVFWCFERLFA